MKVSFLGRVVSFALTVFTCFWILVATDRKALGYVDPGSGLLALQSFASVLAACGYFLRKRLRSVFGLKTPGDDAARVLEDKNDSRNAA